MSARKPSRKRAPHLGFRRHLEGWPAFVVVVLVVGLAVLFGMPREVEPRDVPSPVVDQLALSQTMAADDVRAAEAERTPLDVDIRTVGRFWRAYNAAAFEGDTDAFASARSRLAAATRIAVHVSAEQLRQLRAYQMRQFIAELRVWEAHGIISADLRELGGDFIQAIVRSRWCNEGTRRLYADERVLRTLFKKRWNDVTAVGDARFALSLDEDRVRYDYLVRRPFLPKAELGREGGRSLTKLRLALVSRLGARDATYPLELGRGVVLFRAGRFGLATQAFQAHLDAFPNGPYTLRARNYLRAALHRSQ